VEESLGALAVTDLPQALARARELDSEATKGPWRVDWSEDAVRDGYNLFIHTGRTPTHETHPNAPLMAHLRNTHAAALAVIESANASLREAQTLHLLSGGQLEQALTAWAAAVLEGTT
jgi:hypothetical protein